MITPYRKLPVLGLTFVLAACAGRNPSVCPDFTVPEPTPEQQALLDPADARFNEAPPDTFHVRFETSAGEFVVRAVREWAPLGAQRFYVLARNGFFDGARFFRVLPGFVAQFGVNGAPAVQHAWDAVPLRDEPVLQSNRRGTVVYAKTPAPDSRTTQLFINFSDNSQQLDSQGFSPFAEVVQGMEVVERLHSGYGEMAPMGTGPHPQCFDEGGNGYFRQYFPQLDSITRATVLEANG